MDTYFCDPEMVDILCERCSGRHLDEEQKSFLILGRLECTLLAILKGRHTGEARKMCAKEICRVLNSPESKIDIDCLKSIIARFAPCDEVCILF